MNGRTRIAWNLRRLRAERGVSQESLAADTGIDRAYVSALECEQGNATVDLLERIAGALDVDLGELFERPKPGAQRPQPLRPGRRPRAGAERKKIAGAG